MKKEIDDIFNRNQHFFKSFKTPIFDLQTRLPEGEASELVNMYPVKGALKSVYFKTFRGMIQELRRVNKNCKKYKTQTEIRFILPIKW